MCVRHVQCLLSKSASDPRTFIFEIVALKETWGLHVRRGWPASELQDPFSLLLQLCNYRSLSPRLICLCACMHACERACMCVSVCARVCVHVHMFWVSLAPTVKPLSYSFPLSFHTGHLD